MKGWARLKTISRSPWRTAAGAAAASSCGEAPSPPALKAAASWAAQAWPMRAQPSRTGIALARGQRPQRRARRQPGVGARARRAGGSGRNWAICSSMRASWAAPAGGAPRRAPRRAGAPLELHGVLELGGRARARSERFSTARWKAVALRRLDPLGRHGLLLDVVEVRGDGRERVVAARAQRAGPAAPSTSGSSISKTGLGVGHLRPEEDVEQPARGGDATPSPSASPDRGSSAALRIMSRALRPTVSMGLTRPPSSTGRRPNASRSKPFTAPLAARGRTDDEDERHAPRRPRVRPRSCVEGSCQASAAVGGCRPRCAPPACGASG